MRNIFILLSLFVFIPFSNAQIDQPGLFAILGFNDQHLVYISPSDSLEVIDLGTLGTTANVLRLFEGELWVVHSGDFSDGSGAELWHASVENEISTAMEENRDIEWQTINLPDYSNPWDVEYIDGSVFVSLIGENAVVKINPESGSEITRWEDMSAPQGLKSDQNGLIAVANSGWGFGSTVTFINTDDDEIDTSLAVHDNPQWIVYDGSRFHILCSGRSWGDNPVTGKVVVFNTVNDSSDEILLTSNPGEITLLQPGDEQEKAALGDEYAGDISHIAAYDTESLQIDENIPLYSGGFSLTSSSITGNLYVGSISTPYNLHLVETNEDGWDENITLLSTFDSPIMDLLYYIPENWNSIVSNKAVYFPSPELHPVFPNPFNSTAKITFTLSQRESVNLNLYTINGRIVNNMVQGVLSPGSHEIMINSSNLASGSYFVSLEGRNFSQVRQLVVVK
ncbi:MAG: T9SS type A sorting domain-containing protein [Candidatus Electryonea clarkiae]|nr:T9SS type A sorting domain-containing protein [Candidatus Electryonea clarkiae]MDP8286081.1 T9SS type A sorting domain-containing protein [Candidatus Electryonea clarkiae]